MNLAIILMLAGTGLLCAFFSWNACRRYYRDIFLHRYRELRASAHKATKNAKPEAAEQFNLKAQEAKLTADEIGGKA